ncbi:hypothetical protein, partial [Microbacterium foliorum]|uniref:hypothetical protein n=1 Tax=Microbacterium foliorum TaxID=104336 RepID=UPI0028D1967F
MASRDQTFLVASDDRPSLMHREDPIGGRDRDDPPLIEHHPLNRSGACDLRGDGDGHVGTGTGDRRPPTIPAARLRGVAEGGPRRGVAEGRSLRSVSEGGSGDVAAVSGETCGAAVGGVDVHDEDRCRTTERGHVVVAGSDRENHRESIVTLLRRSAVIEHAPRIRVERILPLPVSTRTRVGLSASALVDVDIRTRVRTITVTRHEVHARHRRSVAFGVEDRVQDRLELSG